MDPKNITIEEKRKSLYTYWNNLPFIKKTESSNFFQVLQSDVKSFIIKYIRDGIEEEFGRINKLSRRHAFTAKELHDAFEKNSNEQKYSQSNFHFHINSLVEDGYIREITKILEGRHYSTYYGRTAISFEGLFDDFLAETMRKNIYDPLKISIKDMHPEIELEDIHQLLDENLRLLQDFYHRLGSWMKEKYPHFYTAQLDLSMFMRYVAHYAFLHEKLSDNMNKIGSLIDLDQIMNYDQNKVENEELV